MSPVVLSDKKDGTKRSCVDYRRLNDITSKDRYPYHEWTIGLICLVDSVSSFHSTCIAVTGKFLYQRKIGKRLLSSQAQAENGFHHRLRPVRVQRAVLRSLQCTCNVQRTMDAMLTGLKWQTCLVYLDNVLLFPQSFEEHLQRLEALFQRQRRANMKLKPGNCSFAKKTVKFPGHLLSQDKVAPDTEKLTAVTHLAVPAYKYQVRSFLGLSSY